MVAPMTLVTVPRRRNVVEPKRGILATELFTSGRHYYWRIVPRVHERAVAGKAVAYRGELVVPNCLRRAKKVRARRVYNQHR